MRESIIIEPMAEKRTWKMQGVRLRHQKIIEYDGIYNLYISSKHYTTRLQSILVRISLNISASQRKKSYEQLLKRQQ
jgi:hypothetical protein